LITNICTYIVWRSAGNRNFPINQKNRIKKKNYEDGKVPLQWAGKELC
jgi:hypothetical protein